MRSHSDQDIRFQRIRNPFTVYCGPHQSSTARHDVVHHPVEVPRDEFKREYPDANASSMANWPSGAGDNSLQWLTVDSVRG